MGPKIGLLIGIQSFLDEYKHYHTKKPRQMKIEGYHHLFLTQIEQVKTIYKKDRH